MGLLIKLPILFANFWFNCLTLFEPCSLELLSRIETAIAATVPAIMAKEPMVANPIKAPDFFLFLFFIKKHVLTLLT